MEGFLAVVGVILIAFILFGIYFIFKQIQFVLVSVNLYKKMVNRQDAMVKLLIDIRDETKKYSPGGELPSPIQEGKPLPKTISCPHCGEELELEDSERRSGKLACPVCGKQIDLTPGNQSQADSTEEPPDFCYHCGAENPERKKLCPNCGKSL